MKRRKDQNILRLKRPRINIIVISFSWFFIVSTSIENNTTCTRRPKILIAENIRDCFDTIQVVDIQSNIQDYANSLKIKELYINNTMFTSQPCSNGLYFLNGKFKKSKLSLNIPLIINGRDFYINCGDITADTLRNFRLDEISAPEIELFLNGPQKVPTARVYHK